jgi:hypothetical protein
VSLISPLTTTGPCLASPGMKLETASASSLERPHRQGPRPGAHTGGSRRDTVVLAVPGAVKENNPAPPWRTSPGTWTYPVSARTAWGERGYSSSTIRRAGLRLPPCEEAGDGDGAGWGSLICGPPWRWWAPERASDTAPFWPRMGETSGPAFGGRPRRLPF